MHTGEARTFISTIWLRLAYSSSIWYVVYGRMLAQTLKILTTKDWNVSKHFALAFWFFTMNLFVLYIIKVMIFVAMSAKTLTSWSNSFTILTIISISPMSV